MQSKQNIQTKQGKKRRGQKRSDKKKPQVVVGSGGQLLPKGDVRNGPKTVDVQYVGSAKSIAAIKTLQFDSLYWTGVGYVSVAIQKGYLATAESQWYPWFAAQFVANYLYSCATGGVVVAQSVPRWLLLLGHAIKAKSAPFAGGSVSYSFTAQAPFELGVGLPIGNLDVGTKFTLQGLGGSTINTFPTAGWQIPPPVYTDSAGSVALNSVAAFMKDRVTLDLVHMTEIVPVTEHSPLEKDVSMYALYKLVDGQGCTGLGGGIYGQLQHEVPIWNPILSMVTCGDDTQDNFTALRNYNKAIPATGDPNLAGALVSSKLTMRGLREKHHPRLKPVDFGEFVDVLALWAQQVYTVALTGVNATVSGQTPVSCPLSFQDFQLLLRNEMMVMFADSQSAVQGISPIQVQNRNFVPFPAGTTTAGLVSAGMMLPIPMIENMRALKSILTAKRIGKGYNWYAPILGMYQDCTLDGSVYTVSYTQNQNTTPVTIPLFTPPSQIYKRNVPTKNGVDVESVLEVPINIIDGVAGSAYVAINSTTQLKVLADLWNGWIKTWNLSTYSTQLGQTSTENGYMILTSIPLSRFWVDSGSQRSRRLERKPSEKKIEVFDSRRAKMSLGLQPYYDTKSWVAMSSQGPILSVPYEQIISNWIVPSVWDHAVPSTEESNYFQKWQFVQDEPFSVSLTTESEGITLSLHHFNYASHMVKGATGTPDDWNQAFMDAAKTGRGGILSALAGFVGNIFPGIAPVAKTIANAIEG